MARAGVLGRAQEVARAQLNTFTAALANIAVEYEVVPRGGVFNRREASRIAVHPALVAADARTTGQTAFDFLEKFSLADSRPDFQFRIAQAQTGVGLRGLNTVR